MNPDLIRRWQRGWAYCRGLPAAVETAQALPVVLGLADRHTELVALGDDDALVTELADQVVRASLPTWLTVMTSRPAPVMAVMRGRGLSVGQPEETFMTVDLTPPVESSPRPSDVRVTATNSTVRVEIRDSYGAAMARGMVGLSGSDAVAHDVYTQPRYRGRGLARAVMGVLREEAVARGATFGLLVASEAGRRLYQHLGWKAQADVVVGRR